MLAGETLNTLCLNGRGAHRTLIHKATQLRSALQAMMWVIVFSLSIIVLPGQVQAGMVDCTPTSGFNVCKRFTYSGGTQSFTVPTGISSIEARVWGAAGGGVNSSYWTNSGGGGAGGFSSGTFTVTSGQVLGVIVGQGGIVNSTSTTYGQGGGGGGSTVTARIGSSGGGFSGVGSSAGLTPANALLMAGGGGGASTGADTNTPYAGGGGGTTGGQDTNAGASGRSATQIAGGAAATFNSNCSILPTAGGPGTGGNGGWSNGTGPNEGGGGGGGGRFGGGGGMCQNSTTVGVNGAGGGGSGYVAASVTSGNTTAGNNFTYAGGGCSGTANSGGSSDPLYTAGIGQGSCFGNGGNGEIVLQYHAPSITMSVISNGDTGTYTFTGTNGYAGDSITTATSGVAVAGTLNVLTSAATATTVSVSVPAGYTFTNATCTGMGGGTMTPTYRTTVSGVTQTGTLAFNSTATAAANDIACTVTLNRTTFRLQIASYGNATTFTPSASTNLASTPGAIATAIMGTAYPASPTAININTLGSSVTVSIPAPNAAWAITAVSCTDSNSAITGNTGVFGTFSGQVLTVAAANIVAGANLNCVITETKSYVFVRKISQGGTGSFSFSSQTNLASVPISVTTTIAGTAAPTVQSSNDYTNFINMNTTSSITETSNSAYAVTGFSCMDANASVTGNSGTFGSLGGLVGTIPSANVKAGAAITCVFTNSKTPTFKVQVSTIGGTGGPFSINQSNLATTPSSITTTAGSTATPSSPTGHLVLTIGSDVSLTQTPPSGFAIASATCTDANSSITGNSGSFGTVAGNQITVLGSQVVAGADITCLFTVNKLPTLTFTENSAGGVATFTITGNNGWSSQNITTVTPGVSVVGATQTLSAPSTATTITHSIPAGFAIAGYGCYNMNGGSGILTYATGILQLDAAATAPGNAIQCTIITNKLPTLTLTVLSNGGAQGFTFTGTNGWSSQTITTVASGVGVVGATQILSYASTSTTITQAIPTGYTLNSISCSGLGSGTATPNLGSGTIALDTSATDAGNTIACTFTNAKIPTFKLQVISQAGFGGPMHFSQTNLASAPPDVSWGAMNVLAPTSPAPINVTAIGTNITVSQTVEYRYATIGVSCTDANGAVTGNTGSFGSLSGPLGFETITIAASQVVAGADFTCILTVKRIARLAFSVVTLGGIGTTGVALPTNQPNQSVTTTTPNTPVAGAFSYFTNINVASTVTITPAPGFVLSAVSCTDTDPAGPWGSGTLTMNSAAGTFTLLASQVVFGANYSCTITTSKVPVVRLQLQTIGGFGGSFTFTQTNLVSAPPSITTTASSAATPASPLPISVSTIGTSVAVTGTPPAGFDINEASCIDAGSAITGNTGSFGSIATNVLTLAAANIVAGADITCLLTSHKLPTITLTVISNGMTGNFDFAGTNGFGTQTIATATPGVGVTGVTKTLAAASTATTITETLNFSYIMVSTICNGLSTGTPTVNTSAGAISFASAALDPGATINCTITNEAAQPLLTLSNAASPATVSAAGSTISYTLNITNVGNVPLTSIAVSDGGGTVTCSLSGNAIIASLSPSSNETCTLSYTTTQADFDGSGGGDGDIDNSATAQTTYGGGPVTASGSSTVLLVIAPQLSIFKSANTAGPVSVNDVIAYTYTVTNTGNVTINNVSINDVHSAFGVPPVPGSEMLQTDSLPSGDSADASANGSWDSLAPGDSIAFSSTYTVVQADIDNQ